MAGKKIEEKSLHDSSIEFSYKKENNIFSFIKNFKIDIPSILVLIIISLFGFMIYLEDVNTKIEMKKVSEEYDLIVEKYDNLKGKMKNIKDIDINSIDGEKLVKIFTFLKQLNIDYILSQNKKTNEYEVIVSNYEIEKLKDIIELGIKENVLSQNTKKEFLISSPGKASIKLIFKQ